MIREADAFPSCGIRSCTRHARRLNHVRSLADYIRPAGPPCLDVVLTRLPDEAIFHSRQLHKNTTVWLYASGRHNLHIVMLLPAIRWLAVWLSGNALASIDVVALRQTRLVPEWVTVYGPVNHLGM